MRHIFTTLHGRRTDTSVPAPDKAPAAGPANRAGIDKWALLRDLVDGRDAFGLTDRNLAVLSALLSFHPARNLGGGPLSVFPSNASLSARLHGMPASTLRRHLAALVRAGMIVRRDSPNGKRYATRDGHGRIDEVFGFDLTPLLARAGDIAAAGAEARDDQRRVRRLRQSITLLMRDLLASAGPSADQHQGTIPQLADIRRLMRRKLDLAALIAVESRLSAMAAETASHAPETAESGANDSQNERHIQSSDSDILESERIEEQVALPALEVILDAAPEILTYGQAPITTWRDFLRTANFVRPMLGVTSETWAFATQRLGEGAAAAALACILQKFDRIRSPGAYLRRLAQEGRFNVAPMVLALQQERRAELTAVNLTGTA